MKRLKLLLGMAALACAIGLTVKYGSAYRPVVGPVREIEEIWAIEDEREESEEPLVTRLFCNGAEAAYDAESNTFYCTLGLENGEVQRRRRVLGRDFLRRVQRENRQPRENHVRIAVCLVRVRHDLIGVAVPNRVRAGVVGIIVNKAEG